MRWYQWVFSGIGVAIIFGVFFKVRNSIKIKNISKEINHQKQTSGDFSNPIQINKIVK